MNGVWLLTLSAVLVVSLISFIGIFALTIKPKKLEKILIFLVSFSAGALFGDAFIHLLPEATKTAGFTTNISLALMAGIIFSFIIEKVIHWRHCHLPITKTHVHPFSMMSLVGDAIHNLIDGLIIAAGFIASLPAGIATTIAVILHEIPQEMGDIGVLLHGGFTRKKALWVNFLTALTAFLGAIIALSFHQLNSIVSPLIIPFAAGSFIYIAGADLIPELHKDVHIKSAITQIITFILGILIMLLLLFIEF